MITKIKKRDGRLAPFNIEKIANAVFRASSSVRETDYAAVLKLSEQIAQRVDKEVADDVPNVEQIQDIVEKVLIENDWAEEAKAYIIYRAERTRLREMDTKLMKIYEDLTFKEAEDNDIKRENANVDGNTAMGTMLKYGSEGAKQFYNMFILKPEYSKAHKHGDIHIHDLDFLSLTTTCSQIDIEKLFKGGFSTGHGHLREPNDIQSYSALACIAIQSNQNDQHGGQSVPNFDYGIAKGVSKTYNKHYIKNMINAIELFTGDEEVTDTVKQAFVEMNKEELIIPNLKEEDKDIEKKYLMKYFDDEEMIEKAQKFAKKRALSETDRSTYQAMEALIHNLNTMHSRAGQVGRLSTTPIAC